MSEEIDHFISVQPENRTLIEESLEYAWHQVIAKQKDPFPELKQPLLTPNDFVSLLAGERGVTDWRPEDTIEQQRKTADKAFEIHRKAGTRHGLAVAMDALDCDIEVTPWYQMRSPPGPYHLEIVAWKRNSPVDKKTTERMLQRVENTKSERDSVDLIFAFGLDSGFSVSGVQERAIMETDSSVTGLMPTSPVCALGTQVAGAVEHVIENEMSVCGVLPNDALCQGGIYFGGGTKMLMCTDITLGAMKTC
ncbi:phage tail protein I [Photobacterium damselae subsp. damselae]|uniref:phage tail protein I n=1 Tax=Photobacterium damselae TaxID=38293 RepID=UPI0015945161|nr:phage tail protein I [Photobacterium damselae]NVH51883.1 phage tail protein I [Photobacterium damselae subsp. damselae]NVO82727.1 phage tail protein I [Photobacterium damselae subsp. damselae]UKA26690.1 phage tail protein I [Photobacterium damselae subsp. damselae]